MSSIETNTFKYASPFPDEYPMPKDQVQYEAELKDRIASDFPDKEDQFKYNLRKIEKLSTTEGSAAFILDNQPSTHVRASLPNETVAMIGGLYALTGASKVNEGSINNGHAWEVVRKGQYKGQPVFFKEFTQELSGEEEQGEDGATFSLSVLSEDLMLDPIDAWARKYPFMAGIVAMAEATMPDKKEK